MSEGVPKCPMMSNGVHEDPLSPRVSLKRPEDPQVSTKTITSIKQSLYPYLYTATAH